MIGRNISSRHMDGFGRIIPEDNPEYDRLRKSGNKVSTPSLAKLSLSVGRGQPNRRDDVSRIELLLERNNFFDTSRTDGPTGLFSLGLESAIKNFQHRYDLKRDRLIFPKGETVLSLMKNASDSDAEEGDNSFPAVPPPAVESEVLPRPLIPGTNIPDEGVPEDEAPPSVPRGKIDPDMEIKPPIVDPYMPIFPKYDSLRPPKIRGTR